MQIRNAVTVAIYGSLCLIAGWVQAEPVGAQEKPRPIFSAPKSNIERIELMPDGDLLLGCSAGAKLERHYQVKLSPRTGSHGRYQPVSQARWRWGRGLKAVSKQGWVAIFPPTDDAEGDRSYGGHPDSAEDFSLNWLRLISPDGRVRVLKRLPMFIWLCDLRFSPDGNEVLALCVDQLWRYNIKTGKIRRVVKSAKAPRDYNFGEPQPWQQVWVGSPHDFVGTQRGATLSPDGRYIVGFHDNIRVFDAFTGRIVRVIKAPSGPRTQDDDPRLFQARFTENGQYLMVEGPSWDKVVCLRWKDGVPVSKFDWTIYPYFRGGSRQPPLFSNDKLYCCDEDGDDILVRSVVSGQIVRRAVNALLGIEKSATSRNSRVPRPLVLAPDLSALYFSPIHDHVMDNRLWRWPLARETKK